MIVLALMLIQASDYEFTTGNDVLRACASEKATVAIGCASYLVGMAQMSDFYGRLDGSRQTVCLPESPTNGQLRDVVLEYVKAHPATRHLPSEALALSAYHEAFPCPAAPAKR
jgi:hypothetical protein